MRRTIVISSVEKGKSSFNGSQNATFKSKGFNLSPNTDYLTWIGMFTTDKKFNADALDTFKPEIVWWKNEIEFKTPTDMIVRAFDAKGLKTGEWNYKRVK